MSLRSKKNSIIICFSAPSLVNKTDNYSVVYRYIKINKDTTYY